MHRATCSLFLAVAASAALIAGCGGGSSSPPTTTTSTSTSTSSSSTSSSTTAARTSSSTSHAASTTPPLGSGSAAVAAYCKGALAAAKTRLTAGEKTQFEGYCASLAHDNPEQIKAAEKTLCNEIVKDTVPAADRAIESTVCAKL